MTAGKQGVGIINDPAIVNSARSQREGLLTKRPWIKLLHAIFSFPVQLKCVAEIFRNFELGNRPAKIGAIKFALNGRG